MWQTSSDWLRRNKISKMFLICRTENLKEDTMFRNERVLLFLFLKQGLAPLPRLVYSGVITAHSSLNVLGSSDHPTLASPAAGTAVMWAQAWLFFFFFVETSSYYVAKAGLTLLSSSSLPSLASQRARIISMSHHAWYRVLFDRVTPTTWIYVSVFSMNPKSLWQ